MMDIREMILFEIQNGNNTCIDIAFTYDVFSKKIFNECLRMKGEGIIHFAGKSIHDKLVIL